MVVMDQVPVAVWLDELIGAHDFSTKNRNSQTRTNENLERKALSDVIVVGVNIQVSVPAGSQICVYRAPSGTGNGTIATIYLEDSVVNVMPGGALKQRKFPVRMSM